jgi:hypothetical protein
VGIGTDSPETILHATASSAIIRLTSDANGTSGVDFGDSADTNIGRLLYDNSDNSMRLTTNASERMRITSGGNVGIGTSNPDATAHLEATNASLLLSNSGRSQFFRIQNNETDDALVFNANDTSERMRITSGGNVGIGTTSITTGTLGSSNRFLEVSAGTENGSGTLVLSRNTSANNQEIGGVRFVNQNNSTDGSNNNSGKLVAAISGRSVTTDSNAGDDSGGVLVFNTKPETGTLAERMRIDSSGKVLIGASSAPNQACEVYIDDTLMIGRGNQNITGSLSTSGLIINAQQGSFIMTLYDDNDTANPRLTLNRNGNLTVSGSVSKGSGSFRIDHPLPAKNSTHYLVHSFIEGPQADLIYRGKVDLVAGSATVNIDTVSGMTDGTFVLLCGDVQCFTSNEDGFTAVKGSVSGNTLTITAEDNTCIDTISWMVVGERKDQHMVDTTWTDDNGKVIVEPLKENAE